MLTYGVEGSASCTGPPKKASDGWMDKNGNRWYPDPPAQRRRRQVNVLHHSEGPKSNANKASLSQIWELFYPDDLLQEIVNCTKKKAVLGSKSSQRSICFKPESSNRIYVMYFRGANFHQKVLLYELYNENYMIK